MQEVWALVGYCPIKNSQRLIGFYSNCASALANVDDLDMPGFTPCYRRAFDIAHPDAAQLMIDWLIECGCGATRASIMTLSLYETVHRISDQLNRSH